MADPMGDAYSQKLILKFIASKEEARHEVFTDVSNLGSNTSNSSQSLQRGNERRLQEWELTSSVAFETDVVHPLILLSPLTFHHAQSPLECHLPYFKHLISMEIT